MRVMRHRSVIVSGFWPARIAASWGAMTVERPPIPTEERKPAQRRACLADREMRQAGASHLEALEAAVAAVQSVLPLLSWKQASAEAINAIAYATSNYSELFWQAQCTQESGEERRTSCSIGTRRSRDAVLANTNRSAVYTLRDMHCCGQRTSAGCGSETH